MYRSVEKGLWQKIREGDNKSFNLLLKLYEPIIDEEAQKYMFGSIPEERKQFLYTSLFEAVSCAGDRTTREQIIGSLKESLAIRKKEEVPSYLSLNSIMGNEPDGATFLDFLDENNQINIRKSK